MRRRFTKVVRAIGQRLHYFSERKRTSQMGTLGAPYTSKRDLSILCNALQTKYAIGFLNELSKAADKSWMDTVSSNQAPTDAILNLTALLESLRMKGNLAAIWKAGDWLDTHLGGKPAKRGDFKSVLEAVQNKADRDVPSSMNHLQKCRQFRLNWEPDEVDRAFEVKLPWRRAIQLTVIKHHVKILAETSPKRAAQIRLKCDTLVKSFPGSNKKVMPAWAEEVEKLKQECQNENPGAQKYHKRLLVDYWQAAVYGRDLQKLL